MPNSKKRFFFFNMKRRYKILSFFALLLVVAYFCTPPTESVVKKFVNQYGSQFLGTDVSIEGFELSPFSGEATVKGLRIANPKGYQAPDLFYIREIGVKLDLKSLLSDTVIVRSINVDKPKFTYEMLSFSKNNVSDLLNNIQTNTAPSQVKPSKEAKQPAKSEKKDGKKVIIQNLVVEGGKVSVVAGFSSLKKEIELPLPTINMSNIGQEKQGVSIAEIVTIVLNKVLNTVSQTALTAVNGVKNLGKASLDQVKNAADNIKNQAESGLKGKLKGLFN